jgi:hypothetical protein
MWIHRQQYTTICRFHEVSGHHSSPISTNYGRRAERIASANRYSGKNKEFTLSLACCCISALDNIIVRQKRRLAYATKLFSEKEKETWQKSNDHIPKINSREAAFLLSECGLLGIPSYLRRSRSSHYQSDGKAINYRDKLVVAP